jgi:hypothetical protein
MLSCTCGLDLSHVLLCLQVVAASCMDVNLTPMSTTRRRDPLKPIHNLSLFKSPIDLEAFYTGNSDSLLDFNHAKQEIVVEVSPVHVLVSEERLRSLALISPARFVQSSSLSPVNEQLPPRLEVLSNFMRHSIDFSISRICVSFLTQAEEKGGVSVVSDQASLEESMSDFLSVASRFDLSFPHEDALSAAMQICIDRLTGVGLPLEDSWEATNLALLNFLEDIAEARREEAETCTQTGGGNEALSQDQEMVRLTIQTSARRTVAMYIDHLDDKDYTEEKIDDDVVIDFPDGIALTYVALFYDHHIHVGIPTLFVANGAGVHLLRVTPPESVDSEVSQAESGGKVSEREDKSTGSVFSRRPVQFGTTLQIFALDKNNHFGKGGLPLAILGTDVNADGAEQRSREKLDDLELGDVELLFSRPIVHDVVNSLWRIFSPLGRVHDAPPSDKGDRPSLKATDLFLQATVASTSILFLSDNLCPFARLFVSGLVTRSVCRCDERPTEFPSRFCIRSLGILNLSPEGELFPAVVSVLPGHVGSCLYAKYAPNAEVTIAMYGLRIVLLRQFLNEFLQYFVSGEYGFGRLLRHVNKQASTNGRPFLRYLISLRDSSLILPRSSSSYEMMCVEVDEATFSSCKTTETFTMPTDCTPLVVDDSLCQSTCSQSSISRKRIVIQGFRIFSSLPDQVDTGDMLDSPAFRFFFAIDGRAKAGKHVYRPIVAPNSIIEGYDISVNKERAQRCWLEITTRSSALEIVVDYAPHLRLLITDPLENAVKSGLDLDMRLSQFCLLLSIWYSNMQELPLMFPLSALKLQAGARALHRAVNFPEYGSEAFRTLLREAAYLTSEVAIVLQTLSLRCTFDQDYVDCKEGETADVHGLRVGFHGAVVHVASDSHGVSRIGSGSVSAFFVDELRTFSSLLSLGDMASHIISWADLCFGLDRNRQQLHKALPQAFQLSVFMTPDWSVYNLGMDTPLITLSDFSPVLKFLEFVSSYFRDAKFGNPSFEAAERTKRIKLELRRTLRVNHSRPETLPAKGSNVDFRLWLAMPTLVVPCDPRDRSGPGVRIKGGGGLWYKYTAVDMLSSQECVSDCLQLIFDNVCVSRKGEEEEEEAGRSLIENLSIGFRLDSNSASNHTDMCLRIPFADANACGITSPRISASPAVLAPPTICSPFEQPSRCLGPTVCELTCIIELLPLTSSALLNLFTGVPSGSDVPGDTESSQSDEDDYLSNGSGEVMQVDRVLRAKNSLPSQSGASTDRENGTLSVVAVVGDVRLLALDPVLGPHLPVVVMSVSSLSLTASQFAAAGHVVDCVRGDAPPEDWQVYVVGHFWADYFKLGLTRSWEPLIEAYRFSAIYEKSRFRGSGMSLNSDSCLHVNVSSAVLVVLDEVVDVFSRLIKDTFGPDSPLKREEVDSPPARTYNRVVLADSFLGSDISHEMPIPLVKGDRVAFSLRNMTGQKIRIFRPSGCSGTASSRTAVLTYLGHAETTRLTFLPSVSMVKNLQVTEVAYPGLPNSIRKGYANVPAHTVDIQLPGFRWLEGIVVDTFGRSFANIVPQSPEVKVKIANDWRLENIMKVLVEAGLENGGRQVTIRSIFSVVNKTTHNVSLLFNPDPTYKPHEISSKAFGDIRDEQSNVYISPANQDAEIEPGDSFQVPTLLFESALRQPGSHLGSMWIKPSTDSTDTNAFQSFLVENTGTASGLEVGFSSKPAQLAKVVSESRALLEAARGRDLGSEDSKSGMQLSCPVVQDTGDRLAPFCYALEIGRSPLVQARTEDRAKNRDCVHGPVAYALYIHPPLVIANLLPEKGRFELMHAVHRTVLWFGDLEPGQQVSVHSVGLDAPLLLFTNLGFAKTPVGEGALVHHGTDPPAGVRGKCPSVQFFWCVVQSLMRSML